MTSDSASTVWSEEQSAVITAASGARLLVEAGPGTGKTAVACARVAQLLNDSDVNPSKILLVSFTRTAVQELRDRIVGGAVDADKARSVRIATIDAHAWKLRAAFAEKGQSSSREQLTYESNLQAMRELLESEAEEVTSYLDSMQHVVVDEAQDILGPRSDLVLALLRCLPMSCGITVLIDPHQAIYGFTTDADLEEDAPAANSLVDHLLADSSRFSRCKLTRLYRSSNTEISELFTQCRTAVESPCARPQAYSHLYETAKTHAAACMDELGMTDLAGNDAALVLFRRRSEVLTSSSFLASDGILHRLRMGREAVVVHAWIAVLLSDFVEPFLNLTRFDEQWRKHGASPILRQADPKVCWSLLLSVAPERGRVKMARLRELLARSRPPVQLCKASVGYGGPILGTIHASKGREADIVRLMVHDELPGNEKSSSSFEEETRVLYVGITRTKQRLELGRGHRRPAKELSSGRMFARTSQGICQVEIGMAGDVARSAHGATEEASSIQALLSGCWNTIVPVTAHSEKSWDYRYRLFAKIGDEQVVVGELTKRVNDDLFELARKCGQRRPPSKLSHLHIVDLTTVAATESEIGALRAPYRESGLLLAPVITGLSPAFRAKKR